MRYRVINTCFLIMFFVLVGGTVGLKVLTNAGLEFPGWAGVGKEYSYLEGRKYEAAPRLASESVFSAEYQEQFDQCIADSVPMRDEILLLNAGVQRACIKIASLPFGYDVYPTFFGSKYAYDSATDSVVRVMTPSTEKEAASYEEAALVFNAFAERHDELDVYIYRVYRLDVSQGNPTYDYIDMPVNEDFRTEHFFGILGEEISVIDGSFSSHEELIKNYFRTDHHWTIEGAYKAYTEITEVMGRETFPLRECSSVVFEEAPFCGSLARSGLCPPKEADVIKDYWFENNSLTVTINGKAASLNDLDHYLKYLEGSYTEDSFTNHYGEYFHSDYGLIELQNEKAEGGTLLIVGDSFTNNIERFFAHNYRNVIVVDPRHFDSSLDEVVEQHSVDDVLFLFGSLNIYADQFLWVVN